MKRTHLILLFLIAITQTFYGQADQERHYVQIDGIISDDTGLPVKYVNVVSRMLGTGSDTDDRGIFSIISVNGDTLFFSSVGFKPAAIRIPENISGSTFTVDLIMYIDTISIGSVLVLPWKTYEEFKQAVIEYVPPEEEMLKNMAKNMAIMDGQILEDLYITPEAGYRYAMQTEAEHIMTRNQTPVNNILNPFAWTKFIDGVKNGMLRNKKSGKKKQKSKRDRKKKKKNSGDQE